MARILQIRRGTAAQNDNFTGMAGEISFDMDDKTLRVHDGEKLGGFALARADQVEGIGENFDITTVPDEFWTEKFAHLAPTQFQIETSRDGMIGSTTYIEYLFNNIKKTPVMVQFWLICQSAEAGYETGDECGAFGIGQYAHPIYNTFHDADGLHIRIAIGRQTFWAAHKHTGEKTDLTYEKWRIRLRVYY